MKTYRKVVAAWIMYPPVVWSTPLGLPVDLLLVGVGGVGVGLCR